MTMDLGQLSQMATWLDEEHRRDKAELIRLQQQVEGQAAELQDQNRVIQDLEGRLAGLQAQVPKSTHLEASLQQLKDNVGQMIAQSDERRQHEARESERVRAIERDNVSRAISELRRELQGLPRLSEQLEARKAEQRRVGESVLIMQQELNALTQEVENKLRSITFLEDSRQQDAKRIARLQQESLEALKRTEQHSSRLQMIDDVSSRQERGLGEMKELVAHLRAAQREFSEAQLLETEQLKRQVAEWFETQQVQIKKVEDFTGTIREFNETLEDGRQLIGNIERFQERISREQTQVSELQRLAEERQKRQLTEWNEESEKRWRKELLRWDHQWGEQGKRNNQFGDLFNQAEGRLSKHQAQIDGIWKFVESQITYETQESRRWLGEMTRLLDGRPKEE